MPTVLAQFVPVIAARASRTGTWSMEDASSYRYAFCIVPLFQDVNVIWNKAAKYQKPKLKRRLMLTTCWPFWNAALKITLTLIPFLKHWQKIWCINLAVIPWKIAVPLVASILITAENRAMRNRARSAAKFSMVWYSQLEFKPMWLFCLDLWRVRQLWSWNSFYKRVGHICSCKLYPEMFEFYGRSEE